MSSCQRILADLNNVVATATASTAVIRPAEQQIFRQTQPTTGFGMVNLTGAYTGADDALIEVEIRSPTSGNERVTQPVLSGAGNGVLTDASAEAGTVAQTVTVTCVDVGTATTQAQAILYADILLQARSAGTGGNAITLGIVPALTLSSKPIGALAEALARDTQEWTDQRLDFGAVPLNPDGTLSDLCPRLVFGRDLSRVYRHYKRWDGEQWQYGVSPKLAAAFVAGSQVHTVTGNYGVTISNGVTTETVTGTTLYDVLLALATSALIEVSGVIANDRRPGGQAAIDLPLRTNAFALPVVKARDVMPDVLDLTVAATAPTETITLECINNDALNAEIWAVKSKVVGGLPYATTGIPYADPAAVVGFTVAKNSLSATPVTGSLALSGTNFAGTGDPKAYPTVCLAKPTLGAAARAKTLTLTWTARPPADCNCRDMPVSGRPQGRFLGIDLGDNDAMSTLVAGHQSRLEAIASWHKTFVAGNTDLSTDGELRAADLDLQLAQLSVNELVECLTDLYGTDAVLQAPARANATAYALYAVVEPDVRNNYRYRCTVAGTSGSSAPTWPTTVGTTVTDGTVTWACVSKIPEVAWDDVLSGLNTDLTGLATLGAENIPAFKIFASSTAYSLNDIVLFESNFYRVIAAGTTGSAPTWGFAGNQHVTGTVTLLAITAADAYALKAGEAADVNADTALPSDPNILRDPQTWVQRYLTACNYVRTLAGLEPKKAKAGLIVSNGSDVWSDPGDAFYWEIKGACYLPVFNGQYYHSCTKGCGADGDASIAPTYEFGFALQVGCPDRLAAGDTITITIELDTAQTAYNVGDTYEIPIVMGGPLAFSGGITGTDTLTWTVYSNTAGALAPYALTLAEPAYNAGGLHFTLHRGSLPFALGDAFTFAVETGGLFRWRQDSGAWSADTALTASAVLADGLTAVFVEGKAPSFVAGDLYRFLARQPYSPSHVRSADDAEWRWLADLSTLTLTFAAATSIECIGILRHALPDGAVATLKLLDATDTVLNTTLLTATPGPLLRFLETPVVASSMTLTITGAGNGALGWVYAGTPWAATYSADQCTLQRVYALERDNGLNPQGAYLGAGRGGQLVWNSWFMPADWASLLALLDDCKSNGDRPVVVVPNLADVQDAALVRIATDTLEVTDEYRFQDPSARQMSLTLPFTAVIV